MSPNSMNASDSVFGHYVQQGHLWEPLISESSPLFRAVVNDDARAVEADLGSDSNKANQFFVLLYWGSRPNSDQTSVQTQSEDGSKPPVTVKHRTLLMLAAFHGSMRVLALLAVNGADPSLMSPDGRTAFELAYSSHRPEAATVVAYLRDAEQSLQVLRGQTEVAGKMGLQAGGQLSLDTLPAGGVDLSDPQVRGMWNLHTMGRQDSSGGGNGRDPFSQDALPYSTAELTKPEYSTDEFRMFCFKILRCCRRYAHDWRACPFAHPTENARRRDPREYKYCSLPCPDYKQGFCIRGDSCPHAHGVFECWLHPSKFRTQLCKDGNKCRRPVCFFSHSLTELRSPTHTWTPSPDALKNPPPVHEDEDNSVVCKTAANAQRVTTNTNTSTDTTTATATVSRVGNSKAMVAPSSATVQPSVEETVNDTELNLRQGNCEILIKEQNGELEDKSGELQTEDSDYLSSLERSTSQEILNSGQLSKKVQAARTAGITPRMSNAFARKHGLNPKDGPVINFQKLSGRPSNDPRPNSAFDRRSQSFDSRTAPFNRNARQRRMKQANHSALDSLNFSMNSFTFGGRPGSRHSICDSSFGLAGGPGVQTVSSPTPNARNSGGGLHHSHSTGEHLRSHSAILPDLTGSLDSSFQLLNAPSLGSASSFLGLHNYMLGHSSSYTPGNSFSVPDTSAMGVDTTVVASDSMTSTNVPVTVAATVTPLTLNSDNATTTTTTTT